MAGDPCRAESRNDDLWRKAFVVRDPQIEYAADEGLQLRRHIAPIVLDVNFMTVCNLVVFGFSQSKLFYDDTE
jgi:hypothetical protein